MLNRKKIIIVITLGIMNIHGVYSQDGHYWTEQYGTRSMLLGGSVIGSVEDLGAVYYNPARISQFETPAFVISGQVYQYDRLRIENGFGEGLDSEKSNFGGGPVLVSGTFKVPFLPDHLFAYAFLTRVQSDLSMGFSFDSQGDFVDAFPGNELFSGEINITKKIRDEWMGLSWSYRINEKFSIGASGFYSVNEESTDAILRLQAYSQFNESGMYYNRRGYGFRTQSILGKLGASWEGKIASVGVTVTTPKVVGVSKGRTSYETFLAGVDTTSGGGDGIDDDVYIINNQDGLSANEKTPWSIGMGAGFKIG